MICLEITFLEFSDGFSYLSV